MRAEKKQGSKSTDKIVAMPVMRLEASTSQRPDYFLRNPHRASLRIPCSADVRMECRETVLVLLLSFGSFASACVCSFGA